MASSQEAMGSRNNVLVIGETGVGKSSLINLIIGKKVATSTGGVDKGSFKIERFEYEKFHLIDTVGYNSTTEKNPTEAFQRLAKFAMEIKDEGISLAIYVMKRGRLTATSEQNYKYFVNEFCQNKVPVLLIVTNCENDSANYSWYSKNQSSFEEKGMKFSGNLCGCTIDLDDPDHDPDPDNLPFLKLKRDRTQQQIRSMLDQLALKTPWKPDDWKRWIVVNVVGLISLGIAVYLIVLALPFLVEILGADVVKLIGLYISYKKGK